MGGKIEEKNGEKIREFFREIGIKMDGKNGKKLGESVCGGIGKIGRKLRENWGKRRKIRGKIGKKWEKMGEN